MLGIKKIDRYILKKFLPLFFGAFFICLFVFMMQFTWRYVDELIGKGLSLGILAQFFWYMGVTLVPTSLPLSVLLASLITFGNMGEQLELLSMKAAGVPLVRIMRPVLLVVVCLTGLSFYFQNKTSTQAQINLQTLLFSMKQQSPALEIPEGIFYNGVPNVNLYVQRKNADTGMLYDVVIYKTDQGFDRAQIVLADSGRLEMTADKMHLVLDLWQGEQFENLQQQNFSAMKASGVPYDRETFDYKRFLIDFDSNFALMDTELLRDMPQAKNMEQIRLSVDSMEARLDSVGRTYYDEARARWYRMPRIDKADSVKLARRLASGIMPFDTLLARAGAQQMPTIMANARNSAGMYRSELEWKSDVTNEGNRLIRRHWVEWHQKMTLSLACLFFFFVGAPLGAIIRKGGLGMPAVISVLIFIFYYIINTSGMKMARDGSWNMVYGMWVSSAVLIPFGAFLTYKSNKDSVVFNAELYVAALRRLLGLRTRRNIARKEVIIDDPDYERLSAELAALETDCRRYAGEAGLHTMPSYRRIFFSPKTDGRMELLCERIERAVEELANSRDLKILTELNELPVMQPGAHVAPFASRRANIAAGLFLPLGVALWLRIWRFRLRLKNDLRKTEKCLGHIVRFIGQINAPTAVGNGGNEPGGADMLHGDSYIVHGDAGIVHSDACAVHGNADKEYRRRQVRRRISYILAALLALACLWGVVQAVGGGKAARTSQERPAQRRDAPADAAARPAPPALRRPTDGVRPATTGLHPVPTDNGRERTERQPAAPAVRRADAERQLAPANEPTNRLRKRSLKLDKPMKMLAPASE